VKGLRRFSARLWTEAEDDKLRAFGAHPLSGRLGAPSFPASGRCQHVEIPPGTGLRGEAIEQRSAAVLEKARVQRHRPELTRLPILAGDVFAHAPSDVGRSKFPLDKFPAPLLRSRRPGSASADMPAPRLE
jgi:hypothetical protein